MRTSPNGLTFLRQNEGRALKVYLDDCGIPTCGVGHVVLPQDGLKLGDAITEAQSDAFEAHDVGKCENAINVGVAPEVLATLSQNAFDALVSLIFNIGVGDHDGHGFLSSTVLRDLNAGNVADEKRAFELWDKDTKAGKLVVDDALLARRDREVALFLTPDAPRAQQPETD